MEGRVEQGEESTAAHSEAMQQTFQRIQSLFHDYEELNREKLDSYEGEIGDIIQRRNYEKKFKTKGNIAHSNLSFQRATDDGTHTSGSVHSGGKDDLLSILNSLLSEEHQCSMIEFDSDIFGRGQRRRQYFFQPGGELKIHEESESIKLGEEPGVTAPNTASGDEINEKTMNGVVLQAPPLSPASPQSPTTKTRATTAGITVGRTESGDGVFDANGTLSDEEEEQDFLAEMNRHKYAFDSLIHRAQNDNFLRRQRFQESLQRVKVKQKEMIIRCLDKFKKQQNYQRMKGRLLELDNLLLTNKTLLAEKKYALQLKKVQSNISAEELRNRYEQELEQQVHYLEDQIEKRKQEIENLNYKQKGIEDDTSRLLTELSVLLYEIDKEEKLQQQNSGNKSSKKDQSSKDLVRKTRDSAKPISSNLANFDTIHGTFAGGNDAILTPQDDISGIFEMFPFLKSNNNHHDSDGPDELTDAMIDQAVKMVEEAELKLNTMRGMNALAEEEYVKKKSTLANLIKGEESKTNERVKKMCIGLEQKISSDEKRIALLENLIAGLKKEKQSQSSRGSSGTIVAANSMNNSSNSVARGRNRSNIMFGGSTTTNHSNGRLSMTFSDNSKEHLVAVNDKQSESRKRDENPTTKSTAIADPAPMTAYHKLLKQYMENSFLMDMSANADSQWPLAHNDSNSDGENSPSNHSSSKHSPATSGLNDGKASSWVLSPDKMEEIINQYRIIAPHQLLKMSKSIEVFQELSSSAASKLPYINAIIPPSQQINSLMSDALAVANSANATKSKSSNGAPTATLPAAATFSLSFEEDSNKLENIPGTRPVDYVPPRQDDIVDTVSFEGYAYTNAVEQLNAIFSMLMQWNSTTHGLSTTSGKVELSMRTEEEELQVVEDIRHEINKVLELLKGTYRDGQQVQRVFKYLSHDLQEELRVCDRLRAELLREVEGLQWSALLQPGQYQIEIDSCKMRIANLKQQLKAMEERVLSRRKVNIRLSQLLTDKRIYPGTDVTNNKFW